MEKNVKLHVMTIVKIESALSKRVYVLDVKTVIMVTNARLSVKKDVRLIFVHKLMVHVNVKQVFMERNVI